MINPKQFESPETFPEVMDKIKKSTNWQLGEGGPTENVKDSVSRAKKVIDFADMEEFYRSSVTAEQLIDIAIADAFIASEVALKNQPSRGELEFLTRLIDSPSFQRLTRLIEKALMTSGAGLIAVAMQFSAVGYSLGKAAGRKQSTKNWNPFKKAVE